MKTPIAPTTLGLALGLLLVSAPASQAVEVTFRINMAVQTDTGAFYPGFDRVDLRGSFDGWGSGITLVQNATNPDIHEGTIDLTEAPGTVVEYKFVIHQEDAIEVWEVNGVGPDGAQNRRLDVPETATTLPVVFFNNLTTTPSNVPVTFRVNLSIQQLIGNFDRTRDTVEVRGSFDDWGPGMTLAVDPTDAAIYQITDDILASAGAVMEYKFVINQAGTEVWEGNVGPNGAQNRRFTVEEGGQTLPVVFFDNLTSDPGAGIPVTFVVHLGVQAALGLFNPDLDTVVVSGQFNAWSTTASPLSNTVEQPYLYQGTYPIKSAPGTPVPHKFVVNGGTWEDGDNRTFVLADAAQVLPTAYFNRQDNLGTLTLTEFTPQQITLEWTAAPAIRLQSAANATAAWADVPNTVGQGSAVVPVGAQDALFRLVGP